jgi:hypothetical protein
MGIGCLMSFVFGGRNICFNDLVEEGTYQNYVIDKCNDFRNT